MLKFFRTNQLTTSFLFILYLVLLRGSTYVFPELRIVPSTDGGYFTEILMGLFNGFWSREIAMVLLLSLQAFFLSYLIMEHRLSREVSLFSGVFYLLLSASSLWFLPFSGVIVANTFMIFALWAILNTYRIPNCADTIFNIGFWIAIATLFEVSYFVFLIWGIFGLNFMRALKLKEILTVLAGFITPYILLSTYFFWIDKYSFFWKEHLYKNISITQFAFFDNLWLNIGVGIVMLCTLIAVLSSGEYLKKKNIQSQKRIGVIFLLMLISLGTVIFQTNLEATTVLVLLIPLSVFMGFTFINISRQAASSIHLIWIVLIIAIQIQSVIFGG